MKLLKLATLLALVVGFSPALKAQERITPGVPDFGGIFEMSETVYLPDPGMKYRIVVDVMAGADNPEIVNPGLWNLARLVNLHVAAGIPLDSLEVVAVFHAGATAIVLHQEAYQAAHGVDNPNLELFAALTEAGVTFYVCGQSLTFRGHAFEDLHEYVRPSYSAMTVLTEHQLKGFAALRFE